MESSSSAPALCAKGCGFFGSPSTMNLCSVCFAKQKHLLAILVPAAVPVAPAPPEEEETTFVAGAAADEAKAEATKAAVELAPPEDEVAVVAGASDDEAKAEASKAAAPPAPLTDAEIRELQHDDWMERVRKAKENQYYKNRCEKCFKKMGLAERFKCRCGSTYCAKHRLPETHPCGYDYQRAGVITIIRNNPLVVADKLRDRI